MKKSLASDFERAQKIADILKALSHPIRIQIIELLVKEPLYVNALSEALKVSQSVVSQQLRILRMKGLVKHTRDNGFAVYSIAEPQLKTLMDCMERCEAP